jgi:hypothetical protein
MMNRVLQFLRPRSCPCCREQRDAERKLELAAVVCERIEVAAGDCIEFYLPSTARYLNPRDDDDDLGIRMLLGIEARAATVDEDLARYAVDELRRMAGELSTAADAIESGVSP